jgi:hypothetical protein
MANCRAKDSGMAGSRAAPLVSSPLGPMLPTGDGSLHGSSHREISLVCSIALVGGLPAVSLRAEDRLSRHHGPDRMGRNHDAKACVALRTGDPRPFHGASGSPARRAGMGPKLLRALGQVCTWARITPTQEHGPDRRLAHRRRVGNGRLLGPGARARHEARPSRAEARSV